MARGATRLNVDKAGGLIFFTQNKSVVVDTGFLVGEDGLVSPHDPHLPVQTITTSSNSVFVGALKAVREDDEASCEHLCEGSKSVFIN